MKPFFFAKTYTVGIFLPRYFLTGARYNGIMKKKMKILENDPLEA